MASKPFASQFAKAKSIPYFADNQPVATAIPDYPSVLSITANNDATLYAFLPKLNDSAATVESDTPLSLTASQSITLSTSLNLNTQATPFNTPTTLILPSVPTMASLSSPPPITPITVTPTEKDTTPPILLGEGTLNNRIDVATDFLQLIFSEGIQLSDGAIELHKSSDNSLVESFVNGVGSAGGVLSLSKNGQLTINPLANLVLDTKYYLTFSDHVIKDLSGNAFAGFSDPQTLAFTTVKPDTTAPVLKPFNPQSNSDIAHNGLSVEFNENVQFGAGVIELHQTTDGSLVDSFSGGSSVNGNQITANGSKIHFNLNEALLPSTQYYLTLSDDAIQDTSGNAIAAIKDPNAFSFTTSAPDLTAPVLLNLTPPPVTTSKSGGSAPPSYYGITPISNQKDVPVNMDLTLNFDEMVKLGVGEIVLHKADGSVVETFKQGIGSAGGFSTANYSAISLNPYADLAQDTQYYLTIANTAISDTSGNAYAGFTDATTLSFTSAGKDLQAPLFVGIFSSADYAQPLGLNATRITLSFNESTQLGSGDIVLHSVSDNSIIETFSRGVGSKDGYISNAYGSFNIITYAALTAGADYYLTVTDNAITDKAGNAVPSVTDMTILKFTQQPVTPVDPGANQPFTYLAQGLDNLIGLPVNIDLSLSFTHTIKLGAGTIVLHNADDNSVVETFSNGVGSAGGNITTSKTNAIVNPGVDLKPATQYYLTVGSGAISDLQGVTFEGFSDRDTLNFFTGAAQLAPPALPSTPQLLYSGPADNQSAVFIDTSMVLAFDRNIHLNNGTIELHKVSDNSVVETFAQGIGSAGGYITVTPAMTGSKSSAPAMLTVDPFAPLAPATQYYLTISDTAIADDAGHVFAGFSDPTKLNFSTEAVDHHAPSLMINMPIYMPYYQSPQASWALNLQFNEEVRLGTGAITLHKTEDNSIVETFTNGQGSAGGTTTLYGSMIMINPSVTHYSPATQYYLTIDKNTLADRAGNAFAGVTDPTKLSFVTQPPDTSAPELMGSSPEDNQSRIATNADIMLNFNEAINLKDGRIELHKVSDNSIVESYVHGIGSAGGTINLEGLINGTLSINPAKDLQLGSQYYLTIASDAITDTAGNAYSGFNDDYHLNFKTTFDADSVYTLPELTTRMSSIDLVGVSDTPPTPLF